MVHERMLSVTEAARRTGLQKETVRRYIVEGRLPAVRLPNGYYRIKEQDLELMLEPVRRGAKG